MAKIERKKLIQKYLQAKKSVSYEELVSRFGVSSMTIRRYIDLLADEGKLIKVVGGAQLAGAPGEMYETKVTGRLEINNDEKNAIALEALKNISPGDIIYIDGSSTCLQLAARIAENLSGVTVVTNSVLVHMELGRNNEISIISLGGRHDSGSYCLVGPETEEQAQKYFVDKAFFSTKGFFPEEGTFESSSATYRIKQIITRNCPKVFLLVDHTKFGQRSLCKVLDVSQINTVITDDLIDHEQLRTLRANVENVVVIQVENMV